MILNEVIYVSGKEMVNWLVVEWNALLTNDGHVISGGDCMIAEYPECPVHRGVDWDFVEYSYQTVQGT